MLLLQGRRNQGFLWKGLANNFDMTMYLNESKLHFKKEVIPKEVIPMGQEIEQKFSQPFPK